jgi:hypothetical protein
MLEKLENFDYSPCPKCGAQLWQTFLDDCLIHNGILKGEKIASIQCARCGYEVKADGPKKMTEQKTLKQKLQEILVNNLLHEPKGLFEFNDLILKLTDEILNLNKEWLTQKLQEKNILYDNLDRLQSLHANDRARNTTNFLIDELLEELGK